MPDSTAPITRRGMLAAGGAAILGVAGGYALASRSEATTTVSVPPPVPSSPVSQPAEPADAAAATPTASTIPFYGPHQAGVETAPALLQTFIGLDLVRRTRPEAEKVLRLITDDAARLTRGEPALGDTEPELAAHPDRLTVTVGIGRRLLARIGARDAMPSGFPEIPSFPTDAFEEPWSQTDLLLQVGTDNALTLAHTVRMLTKDLSTLTHVRWVQPGFRSPVPANPGSSATRNLMGQVDGTVNPVPDTPGFAEVVWMDEGTEPYAGGTVLVLRRIRMLLDTWDALDRTAQESVIGRQVASGAPLGMADENDAVPFDEVDDLGLPVIPQDAHVRVAHAASTAEMILRRPYSYDNGMRDGTNDVGLLFAAYTRDAAASFIPMQQRLATSDAFNTWNTTIGSAAYFLPGGVAEGGFVGERLFA